MHLQHGSPRFSPRLATSIPFLMRSFLVLLGCLLLVPLGRAEEAPRPFQGKWVSDVEATLIQTRKEFPKVSAEFLESAKTGLTSDPLTLTITATDYISSSRVQTISDRYQLISAANGTYTLRLATKDGSIPADGDQRNVILRLKDGNLLLRPGKMDLVVVFKREGITP